MIAERPIAAARIAAALIAPLRLDRAWPLPALAAWAGCWLVFTVTAAAGLDRAAAFALAGALGAGLALLGATPWRRVFIAAGFPLSLAASGLLPALPAWGWLLPLALLALLYPARTWGDAPVFPTPGGALAGLAGAVPLPRGAALLDAGCGLGDALRELNREYPQASLTGIEWSRPLSVVAAWRCRFARVHRGDMWAVDWRPFDLVYLFQRPESMARAAAKAARELERGAWLASLEFEIAGNTPTAVFTCADGRPVWLYRAPFAAQAGARG